MAVRKGIGRVGDCEAAAAASALDGNLPCLLDWDFDSERGGGAQDHRQRQ